MRSNLFLGAQNCFFSPRNNLSFECSPTRKSGEKENTGTCGRKKIFIRKTPSQNLRSIRN
jgi:hypothetical protein